MKNQLQPEPIEYDASEKIIELQKIEILVEILPEVFHKLKNTLTPILGYSQILKNKIDDENLKIKLGKIEDNANKLSSFLDILKNYYIHDGCLKQKGNLNDIINNLKPFLVGLKKTHNIDVKLDLDPKVPDDVLSIGQIESLITNLTENAIQAIKEKNINKSSDDSAKADRGEIEIITSVGDNCYRLSIWDNGIGISDEAINKIWTPFYSSFPKKTGIGLLICERVIFNHDAEVSVTSHEGRETKFEITFKNKQNGQ